MFYTIQRLLAPNTLLKDNFNAQTSTFAQKGIPVVAEIFTPDYMGNSNFEYGALRETLTHFSAMAAQGEIEARTLHVPAQHRHSVIKDTKRKGQKTERTILTEDFRAVKDVHVLAPRDLIGDLEAFLNLAAQGHPRTEEFTGFREALFTPEIRKMEKKGADIFADRFKGWLDLESASFFLRDRDMFEKLSLASGITPEA